MSKVTVTETPWATADRKAWQNLADAIPGAMESQFALWQMRVDKPGLAKDWLPHKRVYAMTALRYETLDHVSKPCEPKQEFTFLVVAESSRMAHERVLAELVNHGFGHYEFMIGYSSSPLVLT